MHLAALVESVDHVCCRYRLAAFQSHFARAGHTLELVRLPRDWWSRLKLFRHLRGQHVLLQRRLLPSWQMTVLRHQAKTLLFDFDDAVFLRDSYSPRGLHDGRRRRRFRTLMRLCDVVIAGNDFLANTARRWAHNVHVIPTCVDPKRYNVAPRPRDSEQVQMVWIGSSSTLQGLERNREMLEALGLHIPGLSLKLVCDRFLELKHLPVVGCTWSEKHEAEEIASADIGISWVPDDDWSRGKCGLKILQYLAAGLPVVANPAGVHREMIIPWQTGYLADSVEQWVNAIGRLVSQPGLRKCLGYAGRELVSERYSVERGAELWLDLIDGLQTRTARSA